MTTENDKLLTGLFKNRNDMESAYNSALEHGYKPEDINIVMSDETRNKYFLNKDVKAELGDKSMEGMAVGGALGGTVGAVIGAIAAIGTALVIPGLGIVIAGPIAAGLAGAGAGSITGGLAGALIGLGIPEVRIKDYEQGIKSGGILLGLRSRSETDSKAIADEWKKHYSDNTQY